MKLLLTSGGVSNQSIENALIDLLGKPIAESSALCIPTAMYAHPIVGPGVGPWRCIRATVRTAWSTSGGSPWVSGADRPAQPRREEMWVPLVRETDALLAGGGDVLYLCHWMRESGLVDLLPSLTRPSGSG